MWGCAYVRFLSRPPGTTPDSLITIAESFPDVLEWYSCASGLVRPVVPRVLHEGGEELRAETSNLTYVREVQRVCTVEVARLEVI